jgi:hypothetical protein
MLVEHKILAHDCLLTDRTAWGEGAGMMTNISATSGIQTHDCGMNDS